MKHLDSYIEQATIAKGIGYEEFSRWVQKNWPALESLEILAQSGRVDKSAIEKALNLYQTFQAFYLILRSSKEETVTIERSFSIWQPTLLHYLERIDKNLGALDYIANRSHFVEVATIARSLGSLKESVRGRMSTVTESSKEDVGAGLLAMLASWKQCAKSVDNSASQWKPPGV